MLHPLPLGGPLYISSSRFVTNVARVAVYRLKPAINLREDTAILLASYFSSSRVFLSRGTQTGREQKSRKEENKFQYSTSAALNLGAFHPPTSFKSRDRVVRRVSTKKKKGGWGHPRCAALRLEHHWRSDRFTTHSRREINRKWKGLGFFSRKNIIARKINDRKVCLLAPLSLSLFLFLSFHPLSRGESLLRCFFSLCNCSSLPLYLCLSVCLSFVFIASSLLEKERKRESLSPFSSALVTLQPLFNESSVPLLRLGWGKLTRLAGQRIRNYDLSRRRNCLLSRRLWNPGRDIPLSRFCDHSLSLSLSLFHWLFVFSY